MRKFRCDRYDANCTDCPIKETCFYLFDLPFGRSDTDAYLKIYEKGKADARAEVIEEIKGLAQHYLIGYMDLENATKYGNENAKQQDISYGTLMRYEIANCVDDFLEAVERLEQKGE